MIAKEKLVFHIIENGNVELEKKVVSEYKKGISVIKIARDNIIAIRTAYRILKRNEVKCENKPKRSLKMERILEDLKMDISTLINKLANQCISLNSFSKHYHVHKRTLDYHVKKTVGMNYIDFVAWKQGYKVDKKHLRKYKDGLLK